MGIFQNRAQSCELDATGSIYMKYRVGTKIDENRLFSMGELHDADERDINQI